MINSPLPQPGLRALEVREPTAIQRTAIPMLLEGRSMVLQSHTGSGKTLAYLVPALSRALASAEAARGRQGEPGPSAIVVAPSQELAMQIFRVARELLGPELRGLAVQCIGGANAARQRDALKRCPTPLLVVGTPGRLAELSSAGALRTHRCVESQGVWLGGSMFC